AGTEGGGQPFWSPDGGSLGFFAGGKLKRVDLAGGPARVLADAKNPFGGAWGTSGVILYNPDTLEPLWKVPAGGGATTRPPKLDPSEEAHRFPSFLPDGRRFVFLADAATTEHHTIRLGSMDSPVAPVLVSVVSNAEFVPPDLLLYVRSYTLLAQRLDLDAKKV